jgi:hypothetical protein
MPGPILIFGPWGAAVPHRGQWVQSAASVFLHCPQIRSPDGADTRSGFGGLTLDSFAWPSSIPFLNSLRLDPQRTSELREFVRTEQDQHDDQDHEQLLRPESKHY